MTKIKKLQHKRLNFPPQEIQQLREKLEAASMSNIHEVLATHQEWAFVRGDLYHWISVLNRFDDVMAEVCEKYTLTGLQKTDFDNDTQKTLVAILHFSRLLLENCINRNLYSSVDRLDGLLNTSDPDVLECTLRLLLRTSQRWSYQRDLKANQAMMSGRLTTLADPWHIKKDLASSVEHGTEENSASHTNEFRLMSRHESTEPLMKHAGVVRYQFFRTAEDVQQLESESTAAHANISATEKPEPSQQAKPAAVASTPESRRRAGHASGEGGGTSSNSGVDGGGNSSHRKSARKSHPQVTPGRTSSTVTEGLVSIHVSVRDLGIDANAGVCEQVRQALDKLVAKHKVPSAHHYELRHRILVALAFATGNSELRYTLLRSRIYAAAVISQLMNEQEFKNMFLSREPTFTADIIGVLQPEAHAPLSVQTAVFMALESLLKQRSEVSGAYVALNASANHGVLMFILRKAFTNIDAPPVYPYEFMSALYFFLTGMANNMNGGQLLVSAGVVPIFVSALKHTHAQQLRSTGRVAKLLDYLISSTNSTFSAFCGTNGIATLVERMHAEVLRAVETSNADPDSTKDLASPVTLPNFLDNPKQLYRRREILPAEQIYLLKELFKLLSHLVQQTSYQDRLRNLVETTLPATLCTVLAHPAAFGSNIYGLAISISAMLVHNEPTSLPIIQEAHIPETMLEQLERHLPYNSDVIINIPGALGAFCLNDTGMEQVRNSKVVAKVLSAFSDPDFIRVLQEGDVTGSFGASVDEFMRHFPTVKDDIMDQIIGMLKDVLAMGASDSPLLKLNPGNTFLLRSAHEEELKTYLDDFYGMMLESVTTFLEGLLEQRAHSKLFMDRGGWELVVQAIRSPLLPFGFVKSRTFESLHGLSSTLLDASQESVFKVLFKELQECIQQPMVVNVSGQSDSESMSVSDYLALVDPASMPPANYTAVHARLHNTISSAGAIALITYLINGSGGGSLTRCVKDITDVMPASEFINLVSTVCRSYADAIQKAVNIEHAISMLPEPSDSNKADKRPSTKGKESETSVAQQQTMDVDQGGSADGPIEAYVRANYLNLGETVIAFTLEAGDFIECMSNSLGLGVKPKDMWSTPKITTQLADVLVEFTLKMLELSRGAERTVVGAQLVDQVMVALMKTLVFARHRIYLKLRIFNLFVEQGGPEQFCQVLGTMWDWAASLPQDKPDPSSKATAAEQDTERLRKILDNTLESMLSILSFILDGEPIVECPEYPTLCHDHDARQCWFRPGDLVVALRLCALPTLQRIWESSLLVRGNSNLMQAFIACLGPILSAQQETRTASTRIGLRRHLPGLLDSGRRTSGRGSESQTSIPLLARAMGSVERSSPLARTPVQPQTAAEPNPAYVAELETMGFSSEEAGAALRRHSNSIARAANDLLSSTLSGRENRSAEVADENRVEGSSGAQVADQDQVSLPGTSSEAGNVGIEPVIVQSEQAAPDTEAMAVDERSEGEISNGGNETAEPEAPTANSTASGRVSSTEPAGTDPYNRSEWRAAKEAEEDERRKLLQLQREKLREGIAPRSIALVDNFKDQAVPQVCGVLELVLRKNESGPMVHILRNAFAPLLDAVATENPSGDVDDRLAAHAYLWAVLLSNTQLMDEIYAHIGGLGSHLLRALDAASLRDDKAPKWLAALLLVVELLLRRDNEPQAVKLEAREDLRRVAKRRLTKLPPSSDSIEDTTMASPSEETGDGGHGGHVGQLLDLLSEYRNQQQSSRSAFERVWGDDSDALEEEAEVADGNQETQPESEPIFGETERSELQRLAMQFFSAPVFLFSPAELNALLRLVVVLTRNSVFATEFLDSGSLAHVLRTMRTLQPSSPTSISEIAAKERTPLGFVNAIMSVSKEQQQELRQERTLVVHVLRHAIETRSVLQLVMENLFQGWFERPQLSSTDTNTVVRGTLAYALRDPELYTKVATERCYLPNYNSEMRISWITLAWRSSKLLDEEEVDRFEESPLEETPVAEATGSSQQQEHGTEHQKLPESEQEQEQQPEQQQQKGTSEFLEYLAKKKSETPYKAYELDAESEKLACRIVEFVVDEVLSLRPFISTPAVSRTATTLDLQPPPTPSKQRSTSYAMLTSTNAAGAGAAQAPGAAIVEDSPETIAYRCFLMQCLSELIASFPFTLQAIFVARSNVAGMLSPRKDKGKGKSFMLDESGAHQQLQSTLRVRSPLISHLVHDLIVREAVTSAKPPKKSRSDEVSTEGTELEQVLAIAGQQVAQKRGQLSRSVTFWATALLSTICVRHQEGWTTTVQRNHSSDANEITMASLPGNYGRALSAARQLALDHVVRAFRECLSATAAGVGGADVIYARLMALANVTYKLVIARPITHGRGADASSGEQQGQTEGPNALKKMVLERGVLDLLTAASSRLDLNHPLSRDMLNVFLRPMEHLAKAAVKISREAVLTAWEESGQEKMPLAAGQRGFNMDLLEDENALIDSDEDIPPDLYENSALGLHQNQQMAAGRSGDAYDEDGLMEEDYEDDPYDDDNSSVSDLDTDDEMDEDILLDEDAAVLAEEDAMEMDTIHEGVVGDSEDGSEASEDEDDSASDESGAADDADGPGAHGGVFHFSLDDGDERMLHADEDAASLYDSDADSDEAGSEGGSAHEHEDGWDTELSDAEMHVLEAVHHHHHHHPQARTARRSHAPSANGDVSPAGGDAAAAAPDGDDASSSDDDEGSGESGDEADLFADDFPETLDITMEAIDEHGHSEAIRSADFSSFILDTIAVNMGDRRASAGLRGARPAGLRAGRPLGVINGISAGVGGGGLLVGRDRDAADFGLSRLPGLGRAGVAVGGVGAGGQSMAHPLLERGGRADRAGGLQARAERVTRSTLNGPLHATPDDVYELGQSLSTRLSQALSAGRRPAYTHRLVAGPSNRLGASPWTQAPAEPSGMVGAALGEAGTQAPVLEQLVRMCRAAAAIDGYVPLSTAERWQEEARMLFGTGASSYVPRIANALLNALIPDAVCQRLLRSRYHVELMRRTAIRDRQRMEQQDESQRLREARAFAEEALRVVERRGGEPVDREDSAKAEDHERVSEDEPVDGSEGRPVEGHGRESGENTEEEPAEVSGEEQPMEGPEGEPQAEDSRAEPNSAQRESPAHESAEANPPEPVYVTVEGERIDITDMGIDLEFLLALPDDLRMEVIDDRRAELRAERRAETRATTTGGSGGASSEDHDGFMREFLDALPMEIREEVLESGPLQRQLLEQEGLMQRRGTTTAPRTQQQQQRPEQQQQSPMSTLEDAVRERVRVGTQWSGPRLLQPTESNTDSSNTEQNRVRERRRRKIASRDIAVQLLSRAELVALARFIFLPNHALSSTLVARLVQCLCENGRTRSQFIHLMLAILDSDAASLSDVDAVIRHALGTTQPADPQEADASGTAVLGTPAVTQFTAALVQQQSPAFAFPLSALQADVAASVPVQRCLEALHSLASHNARAAMHFLVEHHMLRARDGTTAGASRFPLVHLLALLGKPLYYGHGGSVAELLMQLLSTVTKPLGGMVRCSQQAQRELASVPAGESASRNAPPLPGIPGDALRAIVNVIAAGECTSRTFQHTLSLIQNLSHMPGVLPIIADELIRRATDLSKCVCSDISQLLHELQPLGPGDVSADLAADSSDDDSAAHASVPAVLLDRVRDITLSQFSPASSHQSRLLRLLMAIDYISTTVARRLDERQRRAEPPAGSAAMDVDAAGPSADESLAVELMHLRSLSLGHDSHFLPLWESTGRCLRHTSAHPELAHVATVLLPLIESFMVVFKPIVGEKNRVSVVGAVAEQLPLSASTSFSSSSHASTSAGTSHAPAAGVVYFQNFTERHKKVLNTLVRNNPGLLSGSFSLLVYNPHVLDFDNKRSYFYQRLHDDVTSTRRGASAPLGNLLQVNVRRPTVFVDSFHQFAGKTGDEIKRARINVKFRDEEGVDAGGVSREWFQVLARQMFNPNYALFMPSAAGRVTYQPNPQSWANPEHLLYFKFVGRIIGKAIVDQRVLDAYFTRSFYKHILGRSVDYRDMEAIDPSYYKSLEWILENDITDVFEETFSIEVDDFGQHRIIDLIPDGQKIAVTEENKSEYVRLVTEQRLYRAIKDQINAFLTGFHDVIPKDLIQIFNEQELELLISGMPDVDVDDWRNNTEYHGGYNSSSVQIQWFWRAVRMFDHEERAKLLQFVTGTSKVPLEGFAHLQGNQGVQRFQIHKDFSSPTRLPTAHTCFNQLDLPLYESFEVLKSNLLLAISECSTGFGFV